jgi:hypothetical protein
VNAVQRKPDHQLDESDLALEEHLERVAVARRQVRHGAPQPGHRARSVLRHEVQPGARHQAESQFVHQVDQVDLQVEEHRVDLEGQVDHQIEEHRAPILNACDLLDQIQDQTKRWQFSGKSHVLPGRYRLDDRIYVARGQRSDLTWSLIDNDPLVQQLRSPIAELSRRQVQQQVRDRIEYDRVFIVHELRSWGHKQEIEASQQIPVELIEPISWKEQLYQEWQELVKWSQPHLERLAEVINQVAPKLAIGVGAILAAVVALVVIVAIIQAILAMLAGLVVVGVLVAGLLGGCGTDPILIGVVDHEDGTSTVSFVTRYSYPVRRG